MSDYLNGEIPLNFKKNPYPRTQWHDDLVDPITGEVIEDGTPYMSEYANNFEWGIWNAFQYIINLETTLRRMQIQMELDGRVPGNSGTFADTLDGSTNKITLDKTQTDIIEAVTAGTTSLKVASVDGFIPFTQVTIFDDVAHEDVLITAIDPEAKIITVQALTNGYKKGAQICRSNVIIDTVGQELKIGNWGTYSIAVSEVV